MTALTLTVSLGGQAACRSDPAGTVGAGQAGTAARKAGIVMLTGDNRVTAEAVGTRVGITRVETEVRPDHTSDIVRQLREQGHVGLAMSSGTDVATETAGITLFRGDLTGIVRARQGPVGSITAARRTRWSAPF